MEAILAPSRRQIVHLCSPILRLFNQTLLASTQATTLITISILTISFISAGRPVTLTITTTIVITMGFMAIMDTEAGVALPMLAGAFHIAILAAVMPTVTAGMRTLAAALGIADTAPEAILS